MCATMNTVPLSQLEIKTTAWLKPHWMVHSSIGRTSVPDVREFSNNSIGPGISASGEKMTRWTVNNTVPLSHLEFVRGGGGDIVIGMGATLTTSWVMKNTKCRTVTRQATLSEKTNKSIRTVKLQTLANAPATPSPPHPSSYTYALVC